MTAPLARGASPGFVALEGGGARIEVVPTHGGRVRSLRLGGREWLLLGGDAAVPRAGDSPFAGAGWDECAPAAGAGTMPEWVKGVGGRPVPAGGETRLQQPEIALRTGTDGHRLTCTWRGERLPWTLSRALLVRPDGVVEARYEASVTGDHRLPFLWSALLLLPLGPRTRLRLPETPRLRLETVTGAEVGGGGLSGTHQWPRLPLDAKPRDLAHPWQLPRKACLNGWVELAGGRATIQVQQDDQVLSISTDGDGVPQLGLVLDRGGTRDGLRRGLLSRGLPPAIALRPSLGAPDRLTEALGDWQSITWLSPGEPRRWTMTFKVERGSA